MNIRHFLAAAAMAIVMMCNAATPSTEVVKVMTFNVRYDNPYDVKKGEGWLNRRDAVAQTILSVNPDILGTQEVLQGQFDFLKSKLTDYDVVGCGREDGATKGEYEALWFKKNRYEVCDTGNFWLSATPDVRGSLGWDGACVRMASWALLRDKTTGGKILAVNTHLDHVGTIARREGVNLILQRLEGIAPGVPAIVTGDFNSGPESAPVVAITDTSRTFHLIDSRAKARYHYGPQFTYHDFNRMDPSKREIIDYIFVTPGIVPISVTTIDTTVSQPCTSDHNTAVAILEVPIVR